MISRDDAFNKAKTKNKERTESRGGSFESPQFGALETNDFRAYRILGMPPDSRAEPTDASYVNLSLILGDDDRKFRVIWPDRHEYSNWFLWKIYNRVMAYDWDPAANQKKFHHDKKHPSVFNRINKNNNVKNPYERGWTPSQLVAMNVIDRTQMDWHRENQHTVLWSKKASESNGKMFYESGIPISLYGSIIDDMIENYGDWEKYDIVVLKLDKDPWYKVYHSTDDLNRFKKTPKLITPEMQSIMAAPLTEEELSWKRYDLNKLFPITSMAKIYKKLKHFIQQVDESFGTPYYEELEELVAKEQAFKEEAKKNGEPVQHDDEKAVRESKTQVVVEKPVSDPKPNIEPDQEEKPLEVEKTKVRTRKASTQKTTGLTFEDLKNIMDFKGIDNLTPEEKSQVIAIKPNGDFKYADGSDIYKCSEPNCDFRAPGTFSHCPKCNLSFEDEE